MQGRRTAGLLGLVVVIGLFSAGPAAGATFDVTTQTDGTGACPATVSSPCTVRTALQLAQVDNTQDDVINVPAGNCVLTSGVLAVGTTTTRLTIAGAGADLTTLRSTGTDRVMSIGGASSLAIATLTFADGVAQDTTAAGGNILLGPSAHLTLNHVRVTNGTAQRGGGIASDDGNLAITHSLVDGNRATGGTSDGGGILSYNGAALELVDSTVAGNSANIGGGIAANPGPTGASLATTLTRATVAGNTSNASPGGGLFAANGTPAATVAGSIIANNRGQVPGGPIVASNCGGVVPADGGGNLESGTDCKLVRTDSRQNPDTGLATALVNDGGMTPVLTISATSPARELAGACAGSDQRDMTRPQGALCDAGAYEFVPPPIPAAPQITQPMLDKAQTATTLHLSGSTDPLTAVSVYDHGALVSLAQITGAGGWSIDLTTLTEGEHVFTAQAKDQAGNLSPFSAPRAVRVDTTGPVLTFTSAPPARSNDTTPTFAFSASETATFACRLDADRRECVSPVKYDALTDGAHTFTVIATDALGNAGETSLTFAVDTIAPPAAEVSGGPSGDSIAFAFASPEPDASFECRLDGPAGEGAFEPCTSPRSFAGLAPGGYRFVVRTLDVAGNAADSPAQEFAIAQPQAEPRPTPRPAPTPEFHQTVVVRPISGRILVRSPGGTAVVELDASRGIPLGSTIDARKGHVQLASEPEQGKPPQRAVFHGGIFTVTQPGAVVELTLDEELAPCRRSGKASAAATQPKSRRLWGDGKGTFRTRGLYSSATVRGLKWLVQDSCAGTLTRVAQGVAAVRDNVKRRTVLLRGGRSYLARPRR